MKNLKFTLLILLAILACCKVSKQNDSNIIDLSGTWNFAMDSLDKGITEQWYLGELAETVTLPGSMTENGKGEEVSLKTDWTGSIVDSSWFYLAKYEKYRVPGNFKIPFWLKPLKYYKGPAWYQKKVSIPGDWGGKRVFLNLERCHWKTDVYVDDNYAGTNIRLATPHAFELTKYLDPGGHTISIRVDNRMIIPVGINSHSVTDNTQTNWNGIIGKIFMEARPHVFINDVQVFPDVNNHRALLQIFLDKPVQDTFKGSITIMAESYNSENRHRPEELGKDIFLKDSLAIVNIDYPMGDRVLLWSEFSPVLYRLKVVLKDEQGNELHKKETTFGMRNFLANGTRFEVNGHPVFLRGTLECCIFPLTGYPPMDVPSWERVFQRFKEHGLNHARFHSWCPPEAAFKAADEQGFYLQIECSSWANFPNSSLGDGLPVDEFIYQEGDAILKEYGNHPSFCMMAYGNEPGGENQEAYLSELLQYWKLKDRRRVYTGGAGWPIIEENDYHNGAQPRIQCWGAGLSSIINARPPQTEFDYGDFISQYHIPWVSHEIGQWCAYPNFNEIPKYTGLLRATNFEIFRETLEENHMGDQAEDFFMSSGNLQVICYKAEIEAALRTPGFAGFQLLQLHDFPGQGTALVGVLDAFMDPKGYVTPEQFRMFCNETVPLARMGKRVFTNNETFRAIVEMAHFGKEPIQKPVVSWSIIDPEGAESMKGEFNPPSIPVGNCFRLGEVNINLDQFQQAQKLMLEIGVEGTEFRNSWDFWVYPADVNPEAKNVHITHELDEKTLSQLEQGEPVLLLTYGDIRKEKGADVVIGFSSIFWNTAWTNGQPPHTLGILCNPAHALFNEFPTEYHSNWQWWDPVTHSQVMILDGFPPELRPLIQPIDTWFENRRLALLFESRTGKGKLMVCSIDLETDLDNHPAAKQLKYSILKYMNSADFNPGIEVNMASIKSLLNSY